MRRMTNMAIMAVPAALLLSGCVAFNVGEPEHYRLDRGKDGTILVTRQKKMSVGVFPGTAEEHVRPSDSITPMVGWNYWRNGPLYSSDIIKEGNYTTDPMKKEYARFLFGILDTPYALLVAPWFGDYSCTTHYWEYGNVEKIAMFPDDVRGKLKVKTCNDGGCDMPFCGLFTHSAWLGAHRFSTIVIEELDEGEKESRYARSNEDLASCEYAKLSEDSRYHFHIENVEGKLRLTNRTAQGIRNEKKPDKAALNELLSRRVPSVFKKGNGSIPLHVAVDGRLPPVMATVTVFIDNNGDRRVSHVSYGDIARMPDKVDDDDYSEMMALGIVRALNRMTPTQMAKLAARTHQTADQRKALQWLTGSSARTFSVSEEGGLFVEAEHKFTPVAVDFAKMAKFPEIVGQSFAGDMRTGKVVADITGCDENLAIDYLLGRLVPMICRTKAVVFDPVTAPPAGAQYRVDSYDRRTIDGKDIVTINFTALQ